ncbi:MAG: ribosome recycling factor [Dehalococcoidia bacterium]|jgi:ribosome recycling factor|nr:MAG: ribosome recycling factor [Chloroflexota bacterium]|tara:strand:+ start:6093 stop:6650 length:558 start_codon:yes stop_codon:yes gene_type:complete
MNSNDSAHINSKMEKTIEAFNIAISTVRTGRASTSLIDSLEIEVYGQKMPLQQIATLSTPDPTLINIQVWDKNNIDAIMKAIQTSDLGINPSNDSDFIKVPIPPLTEERRKELAKKIKTIAEESKISLRNIRRQSIDAIKNAKKNSEVSEDDESILTNKLEKSTKEFITKIENISTKKQNELLEM